MKKLILLTLLVGFFSCSDDSNSESNNPLIGEWKLKSHIINGDVINLNDCDKEESLLFTQNDVTHREYEDNQCGYTECTLTYYGKFGYTKNDDTLSLSLISSMEYCSNPNGVDTTSTNPNQFLEFPYSIVNGEFIYGDGDEYWIYIKN